MAESKETSDEFIKKYMSMYTKEWQNIKSTLPDRLIKEFYPGLTKQSIKKQNNEILFKSLIKKYIKNLQYVTDVCDEKLKKPNNKRTITYNVTEEFIKNIENAIEKLN